MKIAKEGYPFIFTPALWAIVAAIFGWTWSATAFGIIAFAVAAFFRDPDRSSPAGAGLILSPADGRLVEIRKVDGPAGDGTAIRLSIFMSPLDVHVNRSPIGGRVEDVQHKKGRFIAAYKESSSENNERNALTIADPDGKRLRVVQIAGVAARRIVCRVEKGDVLEAGQRFGIIMFGSRVDLFLPVGSRLEVSEGRRVRGGETILARNA